MTGNCTRREPGTCALREVGEEGAGGVQVLQVEEVGVGGGYGASDAVAAEVPVWNPEAQTRGKIETIKISGGTLTV